MTYSIFEQPSAQADLRRIVDFLSERSKRSAKNFLNSYEKVVSDIAGGIVVHAPCGIGNLESLGYRKALFGNGYVMLYFFDGDQLIIAHLFSQREDYYSVLVSGDGGLSH